MVHGAPVRFGSVDIERDIGRDIVFQIPVQSEAGSAGTGVQFSTHGEQGIANLFGRQTAQRETPEQAIVGIDFFGKRRLGDGRSMGSLMGIRATRAFLLIHGAQ